MVKTSLILNLSTIHHLRHIGYYCAIDFSNFEHLCKWFYSHRVKNYLIREKKSNKIPDSKSYFTRLSFWSSNSSNYLEKSLLVSQRGVERRSEVYGPGLRVSQNSGWIPYCSWLGSCGASCVLPRGFSWLTHFPTVPDEFSGYSVHRLRPSRRNTANDCCMQKQIAYRLVSLHIAKYVIMRFMER